jgi:hypothetical protein
MEQVAEGFRAEARVEVLAEGGDHENRVQGAGNREKGGRNEAAESHGSVGVADTCDEESRRVITRLLFKSARGEQRNVEASGTGAVVDSEFWGGIAVGGGSGNGFAAGKSAGEKVQCSRGDRGST